MERGLISSPVRTEEGGRMAATVTGSLPLLPTPSEHQAYVSSVPPDHLVMMLQRSRSHMPVPHQMYLPSSLKPWAPLPSHLASLVPCGQMPGLPASTKLPSQDRVYSRCSMQV